MLVLGLLAGGVARGQQDLGHKTLGTLGLDAGAQPPAGLYVVDGIVAYGADRVIDRNGRRLPLAVDLRAFANGLGVGGSYELPVLHTYVGASIAAPIAHVSLDTDDPRASLDKFGFGDLYVQPLRLGWRSPRVEARTSSTI